jgi:hypothetical protein
MEKETLEEAAKQYAKQYALSTRHISHIGFEDGANWQSKRMYSEEEKKLNEAQNLALHKTDAIRSFPDDIEIRKWWQTQKFQKEQGEQEYTMIYEIDLPKILKAFTEHFKLL